MKSALLFSFLGLLFACCAAAQNIEDLGDDCNTDHDCTGRSKCFACKDGQNVCCSPPSWMRPTGYQNWCCANMKRRNCEVGDNLETGSLAANNQDLGDDCNTDHDSEIYECTGRTRCFACKDGQNVCCFPPTWMVPAGHQNFCCSNMKRRNCEVVDNLGNGSNGSLAANKQAGTRAMATLHKLKPDSSDLLVHLTIIKEEGNDLATVRLSGVRPGGYEYSIEFGPHRSCGANKHNSEHLVKGLVPGEQDVQRKLTVTSLGELKGQPVTLLEYGGPSPPEPEGKIALLPYACGRLIVV